MYVIWSIEHDAWWRPGWAGYTQALPEAGRYSAVEADAILTRANFVRVNECAIPFACVVMAHREAATLYEVARDVCHEFGLPWTDPRTGVTHPPPPPGEEPPVSAEEIAALQAEVRKLMYPDEPAVPLVVHLLRAGRAVCGLTGTPDEWPPGHRWVSVAGAGVTCAACQVFDDRLMYPAAQQPSFTCPRCGRISHHPRDVQERYCGACHQFFPEERS